MDNIFSNEPDTHSEMLSMCQRVGPNWYVDGQRFIFAYLADIQSLAENDFVAEIVAGGERAWIGAARQGKICPTMIPRRSLNLIKRTNRKV